ncbi:MAG: hypothetical protein HC853_15995, partial [Anaerolineae bacterium]|nr:hypothetical protein [Anaerolineae bacterium]
PEDQEADAMQVVGVIRLGELVVAAAKVTPQPTAPIGAVDQPERAQTLLQITPIARKLADDLGVSLHQVKGSGPSGRITQADVRAFAERSQPTSRLVVAATPKARRLASALGVDLSTLSPTSPDALIRTHDVHAAAQPQPKPATPETATPAPAPPSRAQRRTIAARTLASKRNAPHFYLLVDVDMKQAERLRHYCQKALGWERKPTINDVILRAAALALRATPEVNVSCRGESYVQYDEVNLGIAVSNDEGAAGAGAAARRPVRPAAHLKPIP